MSNVDSSSAVDNPRSLRNLFLDLKSDLKSKSESSNKIKKKFEECVGSSSDISGNSNSNFDEEISLLLKNTNQNGNLLDLFNKKYFIGYAISEAFSGTDLDAYTLFHLWNTKRTSQHSLFLCDKRFEGNEEDLELTKRTDSSLKDFFIIFYQQLFYSWQSELESIDRKRPIFKIPPQDNCLVHAIEPKTSSLIILSYIYGLNNVKFVGLRNDPDQKSVPGPYLSLLSLDSKCNFFKCLNAFNDLIFKKELPQSDGLPIDNSPYSNFDGYLNILYFVYELDLLYSSILLDTKCYSNYTEPILLKSFTSWSFGKASLFLNSYRTKLALNELNLSKTLERLDSILSMICKILRNFKNSLNKTPLDKYVVSNFNFLTFICVVYSYLYSFLSIPLHLLPWENFVMDKRIVRESEDEPISKSWESKLSKSLSLSFKSFGNSSSNEDPPTSSAYEGSVDSEYDNNSDLNGDYNIIKMSVHNEFAETASDSTCIENTRRHDNLMTYVIGLVNGEGNWIKRKEKYVDVIDTYKLGLSWYRRPSFSNTLYSTSYKAWPIALFYYNLLIEPCGRAFFVWYWKNIEAWSCSNIWSYQPKVHNKKSSHLSKFITKLNSRRSFNTDSNLQLKRQVSLRLRDTVSYLFDMELELKKALLYS